MGHARPVVVALWIDEDLGLALQPAKRLRMDDPVTIPLERRPYPTGLLVALATERLVGAHRAGRERRLLERAHALRERVGDPACDLHCSSVLPVAACAWPCIRASERAGLAAVDDHRGADNP